MGRHDHKPKHAWRNFQLEESLDVKDTMGNWIEARIIDVQGDLVCVHYCGWSRRWDEWISKSSKRLAQRGTHSPQDAPRILSAIRHPRRPSRSTDGPILAEATKASPLASPTLAKSHALTWDPGKSTGPEDNQEHKRSAPIAEFKQGRLGKLGDIKVGDVLDAKDSLGTWYEARVVELGEDSALVHYSGWSKRWDEWHARLSPGLAPRGVFSNSRFPAEEMERIRTGVRRFKGSKASARATPEQKAEAETASRVAALPWDVCFRVLSLQEQRATVLAWAESISNSVPCGNLASFDKPPTSYFEAWTRLSAVQELTNRSVDSGLVDDCAALISSFATVCERVRTAVGEVRKSTVFDEVAHQQMQRAVEFRDLEVQNQLSKCTALLLSISQQAQAVNIEVASVEKMFQEVSLCGRILGPQFEDQVGNSLHEEPGAVPDLIRFCPGLDTTWREYNEALAKEKELMTTDTNGQPALILAWAKQAEVRRQLQPALLAHIVTMENAITEFEYELVPKVQARYGTVLERVGATRRKLNQRQLTINQMEVRARAHFSKLEIISGCLKEKAVAVSQFMELNEVLEDKVDDQTKLERQIERALKRGDPARQLQAQLSVTAEQAQQLRASVKRRTLQMTLKRMLILLPEIGFKFPELDPFWRTAAQGIDLRSWYEYENVEPLRCRGRIVPHIFRATHRFNGLSSCLPAFSLGSCSSSSRRPIISASSSSNPIVLANSSFATTSPYSSVSTFHPLANNPGWSPAWGALPSPLSLPAHTPPVMTREVVLKEFLVSGPMGIRRLRRSAHIMARVQHPNIMPLTGILQKSASEWYLEMPYFPNGDLRRWIQAGSTAQDSDTRTKEAFSILRGILQGLDLLHQVGILHRDIKPENVLLEEYPPGSNQIRAVITDFEVSRVSQCIDVTLGTKTGILGTPGYIDPLVVQGSTPFSSVSDMYSFGVLMGEVLTGEKFSTPEQVTKVATLDEQTKRVLCSLLKARADRPSPSQLLSLPLFSPGPDLRFCCICLDHVPSNEGIECDNPFGERHFLSLPCFRAHVIAESTKDLDRLKARQGKVFCPGLSCRSPAFSDLQIALGAGQEGFDAYQHAHKDLVEAGLVARMELEKARQIELEVQRLSRLDSHQREVETAMRHIQDDILTLKCPRCRACFTDFDGCFALTCRACPCAFCAWCLADCGADAHAHVIECRHNIAPGRPVFAPLALFERAHRERQRRLISEYLATSGELGNEVLNRLAVNLQEAGLGYLVPNSNRRERMEQEHDWALALALEVDDVAGAVD